MSQAIAAGALVRDSRTVVARVRSVAISPTTLQAAWLIVEVLDDEHVTAVPTFTASVDSSGDIRIPFSREQLLAAPVVADVVDDDLAASLRSSLGLA